MHPREQSHQRITGNLISFPVALFPFRHKEGPKDGVPLDGDPEQPPALLAAAPPVALPAPAPSAAGRAADSFLGDGWKHPCFQLFLLPMEKTSPGRGRKNRGSNLVKKYLDFP